MRIERAEFRPRDPNAAELDKEYKEELIGQQISIVKSGEMVLRTPVPGTRYPKSGNRLLDYGVEEVAMSSQYYNVKDFGKKDDRETLDLYLERRKT